MQILNAGKNRARNRAESEGQKESDNPTSFPKDEPLKYFHNAFNGGLKIIQLLSADKNPSGVF